jgi:hypothetical protein
MKTNQAWIHRDLSATTIVVASLAAACACVTICQAQPSLQLLYSEDFSKDPGWTTDDSAKLRWDSASGTFRGTQVNTEGTYAYINLPRFNPNAPWRLEWDHCVNSCEWSAGFTFGLMDTRISYPYNAGFDMGLTDGGYGTALWGIGGVYSPPWQLGVWYHSVMRYDPASQQLTLAITNSATGLRHMLLRRTVASFPAGTTRIGVSRLHMKNTGPGASASATVDYVLDNIRLFAGADALARPPVQIKTDRLRINPSNQRYPALASAWTNSLGMKFVPVTGTEVLFCIWETRVKDYRAYAQANSGVDRSWENPVYRGQNVTPSEDCPVVMVSWEDAKKFCEWLTAKERQMGLISAEQSYRLPYDWEWSVAVGLEEPKGGTPMEKGGKIRGVYPWGTEWPPPKGAGNYADATAKRAFPDWTVIEGYDDGYATTAPVGSFSANRYGLYDLGGNVWEWCEDFYDGRSGWGVLRGGTWLSVESRALLSSFRLLVSPSFRYDLFGFRVVLVGASAPR